MFLFYYTLTQYKILLFTKLYTVLLPDETGTEGETPTNGGSNSAIWPSLISTQGNRENHVSGGGKAPFHTGHPGRVKAVPSPSG